MTSFIVLIFVMAGLYHLSRMVPKAIGFAGSHPDLIRDGAGLFRRLFGR